jgi:hypothetical protein
VLQGHKQRKDSLDVKGHLMIEQDPSIHDIAIAQKEHLSKKRIPIQERKEKTSQHTLLPCLPDTPSTDPKSIQNKFVNNRQISKKSTRSGHSTSS